MKNIMLLSLVALTCLVSFGQVPEYQEETYFYDLADVYAQEENTPEPLLKDMYREYGISFYVVLVDSISLQEKKLRTQNEITHLDNFAGALVNNWRLDTRNEKSILYILSRNEGIHKLWRTESLRDILSEAHIVDICKRFWTDSSGQDYATGVMNIISNTHAQVTESMALVKQQAVEDERLRQQVLSIKDEFFRQRRIQKQRLAEQEVIEREKNTKLLTTSLFMILSFIVAFFIVKTFRNEHRKSNFKKEIEKQIKYFEDKILSLEKKQKSVSSDDFPSWAREKFSCVSDNIDVAREKVSEKMNSLKSLKNMSEAEEFDEIKEDVKREIRFFEESFKQLFELPKNIKKYEDGARKKPEACSQNLSDFIDEVRTRARSTKSPKEFKEILDNLGLLKTQLGSLKSQPLNKETYRDIFLEVEEMEEKINILKKKFKKINTTGPKTGASCEIDI